MSRKWWGVLFLGLILWGCDSGSGGSSTPDLEADQSDGGDLVVESGSVDGRVGLSDGGSPAGASVTMNEMTVQLGDDGVFGFQDLNPGTYPLLVTLEGYVDHQEQVEVTSGATTVLEVVLNPVAEENTAPVLTGLTANPEILGVGGETLLTAIASDADGDPLSYEWSLTNEDFALTAQEPASSAQLVAPSVEGASVEVRVVVRDGKGGEASGAISLTTGANNAPVIDSLVVTPEVFEPGEEGLLEVSATDIEGDSLTYLWSVDDDSWTLGSGETSLALIAPDAYGASVQVMVEVRDSNGASVSATLEVVTADCADGLIDCDQDASNGCELPTSGLGPACAAPSCAEIVFGGVHEDGVYWLETASGASEVFCDMTTDGGGWVLLGTISGADEDQWATQFDYWADNNTLGSLDQPWLDFKSQAWFDLDVTEAELLIQRRYGDEVKAITKLGNVCLDGASRFQTLFGVFDGRRACEHTDVQVLMADESAEGVSGPEYLEGANLGLGGAGTNGLCWTGSDNAPASLAFSGHFFWNDDPSSDNCISGTHAGGIGIFSTEGSLVEVADITSTSWLAGTDYSQTAISIFARQKVRILGALTEEDPGHWPLGVVASSCLDYVTGVDPIVDRDSIMDGVYLVDRDGSDGPLEAETVYCDMSADGGGWELLGTVYGGDDDHWNTEYGYWSDDQLLGTANEPWLDYKSPLWNGLDLSHSELMVARRYDGAAQGKTKLGNACLRGATHFVDLFQDFNESTALACTPADIGVLESSPLGVANADYIEGGNYGIGGAGTNGLCWGGGDTDSNIFSGHFVWNQYPGVQDCMQIGHLGGVGVWHTESAQFEVRDITHTNWLSGTDEALTSISFFARPGVIGLQGDLSAAAPGFWSDHDYPDSCAGYADPAEPLLHEASDVDGWYLIDPAGNGPVAVYCLHSEGDGWMRAAYWSREDDGHGLVELADEFTYEFFNMGELHENQANRIRWSDGDSTYDALAWVKTIDTPNIGEVRLRLHYDGVSMESSGVWFFVQAGGNSYDLFCWDDTASAWTGYDTTEQAQHPGYICADGMSSVGESWTWEEERSLTLTDPITEFRIHSLHADCCMDGGDSSDLYSFELLVR